MASDFEIIDQRFRALLRPDSKLDRLWTGSIWAEGPVYFAETDQVLWSDIPNNRMLRWSDRDGAGVWREPANFTNGHTRDREGRLVSCEHGGRRVSRTDGSGRYEVLVDRFDGKRLNSPNDVVVKSDGTIWFTDPPYGILSDWEGCFVFRFDPQSGKLGVVADDFVKPNGIAFSPDERILYIADTGGSHDPNGPHHIRAFDVVDGTRLARGRVFAVITPGFADGFRLDTQGNVWTSAGDGIHVFTPEPEAKLIGKIKVPEKSVANLVFGGPDKNRIFIAATTSLYAVMVAARGAQTP